MLIRQKMKDMYMETCMIYDSYKLPPKTQKYTMEPKKMEVWKMMFLFKGVNKIQVPAVSFSKRCFMIRFQHLGFELVVFSSKEVEVTWIT